jgi:hypothetical protein
MPWSDTLIYRFSIMYLNSTYICILNVINRYGQKIDGLSEEVYK